MMKDYSNMTQEELKRNWLRLSRRIMRRALFCLTVIMTFTD